MQTDYITIAKQVKCKGNLDKFQITNKREQSKTKEIKIAAIIFRNGIQKRLNILAKR